MSKSNVETMKRDEMKVLDVLRQHAKDSISELGKRSDLSPQKVARIIKNLEKKKIIWGYSAITSPDEKSSYYTLLLKRSTVSLDDSMKREVIVEKLDDFLPSGIKIENIFITHGGWDAIVTFYAPNLVTAKKVVGNLFQRTGKYFNENLLLENLFPIRKQGIKNPQIKDLVDYI